MSDRQRNVSHAGLDDMLTYQELKKFISLRNDIEHALHRQSGASGTTDVAPQMIGILNVSSTLLSDHSGVTLTEDVFTDIMQRSYSYEIAPRQVYCGPLIKRTISQYNTKVTRNIDASEKRQILRVDELDTDFGSVDVMMSRDQITAASKTTDTANTFIVIDPDYLQTGWLQRVRRERLSRDGLRDRFQISAELTLIYRTPVAINGATNCRPYIT